jgi:DNA repair protein RadC
VPKLTFVQRHFSAVTLKIAHAAENRMMESKARAQPVLSSWQALLNNLRVNMAHEAVERVRVLFLNSKNMLIANEPMWEGSVDESAVHIREVLRRALDLQPLRSSSSTTIRAAISCHH